MTNTVPPGKGRKADGRSFYNRNAAKWTIDQDEQLSDAIQQELQKGAKSKREALRRIASDRAVMKKLPGPSGAHRVSDGPGRAYGRIAKRAQQPTVKVPGIARALGLGDRLSPSDVEKLQADIEAAEVASRTRAD